MKTLVATSRTQGERDGDFTWCVDGELVWLGLVCDRDQQDPDGGCGCGRAFAGLSSARATTTAMVREVPMTYEEYVGAIADGLDRQGWGADEAEDVAAENLELAADFPDGTVLSRRLDDVLVRS